MANTAEESTAVCAICGKELPLAQMEEFCGRPICRSCLAAETFVCACCGRRIPRSERAASSGGGICQACFDERFTRCCICGRVLRQSEAHWRGADGTERPFCPRCLEAGLGALIRPAEASPADSPLCPSCHAPVQAENQFCIHCGAKLGVV